MQFEKKIKTTLRQDKFKPKCIKKQKGMELSLSHQRYWYTEEQ